MSQPTRRVVHIVLACVPFVMMLVVIPFVNRTDPYVLGLPFLLFWIVLSVVMTSVCMAIVYRTDPANRPGAEESSGSSERPGEGSTATPEVQS